MAVREGYKQTEVGIIPEDWECFELGNISKFSSGKAHEDYIKENGQFVVVNSKFVSTESEVKKHTNNGMMLASYNDILIVMSDVPNGRAIAKCFLVKANDKYTVNQRIGRITILGHDPLLLFYKIDRNPYYLSFDDGVKQTNLRKQDVLSLKIVMPKSVIEQKAIATALSDIDGLINSLTKLIEKKKNIKQGAMQELLTGKKRLEGFSGDWLEVRLSDIVWFQEGPGVRAYQFTRSGMKLLNGTNIQHGKLDLRNTDRYISLEEAHGAYSHFLADEGDVVIASSGVSIDKFHEKVTEVRKEHLPFCMNTSTIRFKIKKDACKYFFINFLKSNDFKSQIGGEATGSAQLNFGPAHLSKVVVKTPPTEYEQSTIGSILYDMDWEIELLVKKLYKYKAIKQGMMQELLTGRIRLLEGA